MGSRFWNNIERLNYRFGITRDNCFIGNKRLCHRDIAFNHNTV